MFSRVYTTTGNSTLEISCSTDTIQPSNLTSYEVDMDQRSFMTLVHVNVTNAGAYVFFLEHNPAEFEGSGTHYFKVGTHTRFGRKEGP